MNEKRISRRTIVAGGGVAAALGATALGLTLPKLFAHRYAATPYDDLLAQLVDRDAAARVGAAVRAGVPAFDAPKVARELRQRFARRNLSVVSDADISEGRLAEAGGWVMPASLSQLCALAAG